ncbi:MAG TPA: sialidase family protein, partial [Fimbriimonadaceae bacterium]
MLFKNRIYALISAVLATTFALGYTNKDRELLVAAWNQSQANVSNLVADFGKVVAREKESGMFVVELKAGISADEALKDLKNRKGIRFALPESARTPNTSNFYALDNYVRYADAAASLTGDSDKDKDADKKPGQERDKLDFYAALRYYLRGRVDANGYIDENAIRAAIVHKSQMPVAHIGAGHPTNPPPPGDPQSIGTSWTFLGPNSTAYPYQEYYGTQTVSGRITAIAVDPTNANIVFTGSGGGGLWKSTTAGASWTCVSDKSPWKYPSVSSIAIDPLNTQIIYVGTGDYDGFFQGYNQGVMKSTDGGTTWTNLGSTTTGIYNLCVSHIVVDPTNDQIVTITTGRGSYAATYEGTGNVFRSTNGGTTWASAGLASADFCTLDISIAGTGGARTYWAGSCLSPGYQAASLYKSTNQGASWTAVTPPDTSYPTSSWELATSKVNANTLYVLDTGGNEIWKSTTGGSTWTNITTATFPVNGDGETNWGQSNYDYVIGTYAAPNA